MQKSILLAVDAPGPAEFIKPVIPFLKKFINEKGFDLELITVKESPTNILKEFAPERCDLESSAEAIYKKFKPDFLIIAMSSLQLGPYVNREFARLARKDNKPVISFQDYWANHRWEHNQEILSATKAIIVPDKLAKSYLYEDRYKGEIFITGSPAFEKFKAIDVVTERRRLRSELNIQEDAFVILHAGTGTPQSYQEDEITFNFLADTFREFKKENENSFLISRPHPRDEEPGRYQRLAPDIEFLDTSAFKSSEEILSVADVVVAMYSTALIHACYLRIPAVSILLPNAGMKRLKMISLHDFPPNKIGASIGVYDNSVENLRNILNQIKSSSEYREKLKKAQEENFPFYKESSKEKVFKAISKLFVKK